MNTQQRRAVSLSDKYNTMRALSQTIEGSVLNFPPGEFNCLITVLYGITVDA